MPHLHFRESGKNLTPFFVEKNQYQMIKETIVTPKNDLGHFLKQTGCVILFLK